MPLEPGHLRVVATDAPGAAASPLSEPGAEHPAPGQFLREQRLRRGLSLDQLAAATKIPRASLELLEDDRFDQLPGPVFVRGFLRCCARALSVDPAVVLDLVYEQERHRLQARRRERTGAQPAIDPPRPPPAPRLATVGLADVLSALRILALRLRGFDVARGLLWLTIAFVVAYVVLQAFQATSLPGPSGSHL